ncbi:type III glutamate--ammonia ligase [Cyanobium sp. Morenito 9A2]|uniref:type III glutamate--ammonia ligase n=1 Tax=Cyanobium sp. Morenito 9A2 TaxID=2823718 RepID=UPI0020CFAFB9|nr:type III glutamate--ammonia ligase [Cyanobium sp. Morenito 9A2]MCP9850111.1 type III glutamate--ammonia ligase [Cyanobium sp. Morenito 9A2]
MSLQAYAQTNGIAHFLISFTDLFGVQRAKLVPASAMAAMESAGAGFAGFAAWLDLSPADGDVLAIPDPSSLMPLPWQPDVAWVAGDLVLDGVAMEQSPRQVLKRQLERAERLGFSFRSGVEAEFFLLDSSGEALLDAGDRQSKPCYDQLALMRQLPLVAGLVGAMESLGWGPYQADHEDANGQFELNWTFDHGLVTADRHAFFKVMVKTLAERHGGRATFMPKPFGGLTGNGCHCHISLWDAQGRNLFHDPAGELGLSALAYHFLAGLMEHSPALSCLTNPTVNSYRRLAAPPTSSGATWSPGGISYSGNNRTHMVRIPDDQRLELRLPDGAANPYLLQAVILAAGLDGIERQLDPGPRSDNDSYADPGAGPEQRPLPGNLGEALAAFAADGRLRQSLGEPFCRAYERLRGRQWQQFNSEVSSWEREHTLDC